MFRLSCAECGCDTWWRNAREYVDHVQLCIKITLGVAAEQIAQARISVTTAR